MKVYLIDEYECEEYSHNTLEAYASKEKAEKRIAELSSVIERKRKCNECPLIYLTELEYKEDYEKYKDYCDYKDMDLENGLMVCPHHPSWWEEIKYTIKEFDVIE